MTTPTPELQAAVDSLTGISRGYGKAASIVIRNGHLQTILTALEAAQKELGELRRDKERLIQILKHWQSHNQLSIPTNAAESEAVGEDFTAVWFETQEALDAAIQKAT